MHSRGMMPKSVLVLETLGMILLGLAWLSLHHVIQLPAPFASPVVGVAMLFFGVLLMLPAAIALIRLMAQTLAPQLMQRNHKPTSQSDQEKRDDADH